MTQAPRKYRHILAALYDRPWAILPATLGLIIDIAEFRAAGGELSQDEIQARIEAASNGPRKGGRQAGTVAVIPAYGPISMRQNLMSANSGGTSIEGLTADFRAAMADPAVDAVVFEIDSPGGTIDGIPELADEIYAARGQKPILAHANTMAASAAYWIGTAADQLMVAKSGAVGSIGVFTAHQDESKAAEDAGVKTTLVSYGKYKTEGNRWEPLSDDARANLQAQVDAIGGMFEAAVARGRGVPIDTVRKSYGQGRIVLAKEAVAAGMADGIATLDDTIRQASRLAIAGQRDKGVAAANLIATNALDTALPFEARLALVTAGTEQLLEHGRARFEMRHKDGRPIPERDRAGLLALSDSLRQLAELEPPEEPDPEPEPTPEPEPSNRAGNLARLRVAQALAELG